MAPDSGNGWRGVGGALALALVLHGCSHSSKPPITSPAPEPGFVADSPANAVRLLQWSMNHRDLARYRGLFTDDFLFGCAASDTAGNAFRGRALTRFDHLESTKHLFVGGGVAPPANRILLQFDQNLIEQQDSRPGKQDMTYYREIVTSTVLRIKTDQEEFQITGAASFHLARGDVALIPADLGVPPDPGRWYIERWDDGTVGYFAEARAQEATRASSLRAQPAKMTTWCSVLALYR